MVPLNTMIGEKIEGMIGGQTITGGMIEEKTEEGMTDVITTGEMMDAVRIVETIEETTGGETRGTTSETTITETTEITGTATGEIIEITTETEMTAESI